MPGICTFKRFNDEWVLHTPCTVERNKGDCPKPPDANSESFRQSLKAHLGSGFEIEDGAKLELPCTESESPGSYKQSGYPTLTFKDVSKAGGEISGILEVTVLALPAPPPGGDGE